MTTTTTHSTSRMTVAPTNTSSPMEENIILFTAVPVLLILFITVAIITIGIILLFIVCRRKTYNSSHTTKHPKYAEVELQQNECYASCNNNDKPPQYVQHDLLHMNNNTNFYRDRFTT